ncbi:MAG TPA: hypothetical protein VK708_07795 [Bryobacteraceae bacterium]|nr:hypothetical protein [Bryobacteraceae bacterium]
MLVAQTFRVPFVGCAQDGQAGPVEAPIGTDEQVRIDTPVARKLAFYSTGRGFGVLAPRGWFCFGNYGSSGAELFVSPRPLKAVDLFGPNWGGIAGPAVELERTQGGGSGTALVAAVLARVFPAYRPFVQGLIDAGDLPAAEYTFGPYPDDKLITKRARLVRFQTPAHAEGLGTMGQVKANDDPIDGAVVLQGKNPDLLMLRVRLPPEQRDLASVIIQQLLIRQRRNAW